MKDLHQKMSNQQLSKINNQKPIKISESQSQLRKATKKKFDPFEEELNTKKPPVSNFVRGGRNPSHLAFKNQTQKLIIKT
jgi:hypothetical protein